MTCRKYLLPARNAKQSAVQSEAWVTATDGSHAARACKGRQRKPAWRRNAWVASQQCRCTTRIAQTRGERHARQANKPRLCTHGTDAWISLSFTPSARSGGSDICDQRLGVPGPGIRHHHHSFRSPPVRLAILWRVVWERKRGGHHRHRACRPSDCSVGETAENLTDKSPFWTKTRLGERTGSILLHGKSSPQGAFRAGCIGKWYHSHQCTACTSPLLVLRIARYRLN